MNVTTTPVTGPPPPCEAGRTTFLPVGPRGPCPRQAALTAAIAGARPLQLCSEHTQLLRDWAQSL